MGESWNNEMMGRERKGEGEERERISERERERERERVSERVRDSRHKIMRFR